ncbi:conjugative transfer signal peptidase TraF [Rhizobium herbae]|uniref:Conjugative transfer signal peptidase TraF n=1 Tax=Rhizobium herbae TaxID=508661 RepID=A0ABS4EU95_9HYPH|nr:conjugative transfer signal peptidase TraF [Rhizobium herbae]MBP1861518.1 conjugative transfer signal peptidase TraF [Rhizobium herbae]
MIVVEIRPQTKATLQLLSFAVTIAVLVLAAGWFGGYRINMTPSYPLGLWRIQPLTRGVRVDDRVFICPPDNDVFRSAKARGYLRDGLCPGGSGPFIKTVAATAGQRVEINGSVKIDGILLPRSLTVTRDGQGRPLTEFAGGVIPRGFLFLHSGFVGSYDSRYFGPIPQSGVLGLAQEVFTYVP